MVVVLSGFAPVQRNECLFQLHPALIENELLSALMAGDESAMHKLYKLYSSSLYGIISKLIKHEDTADDILQEVFVKVWKSIHKYDPDKGKLFTWMAAIARNSAIDHLRGEACAKNLKTMDIEGVSMYVDKRYSVNYNVDTIGIKELIDVLPCIQKQILDLVYFQGYTQVEVSEALQIPLGSVKSKIRYAILSLRTYFA